jgi:hypothetical protein
MNKISKKVTQFHFKNFVSYIITYFYPLTKLKRFTIQLKTELDDEVLAIYEYYRVIFFNVILFIINNTDDNTNDKILQIIVKHDRFTETGGSYYQAIFKFTDDSPIINYTSLNDILRKFKNCELKNIDNDKLKIFDIGIITSYYIVNSVYNSEFSILSNSPNQYIISLYIYATGSRETGANTLVANNPSQIKNVAQKLFKRPKSYIEEVYYNRIVEKIFSKKRRESFIGNNSFPYLKKMSKGRGSANNLNSIPVEQFDTTIDDCNNIIFNYFR